MLAQFVDGRLESHRQFVCGPGAPVVEKDDHRAIAGHVVMNGDDIETVLAQRLQHRSHFALEHRDVADELGSQGKAYVEREYRWPTVMGRIESLLAEIRPRV